MAHIIGKVSSIVLAAILALGVLGSCGRINRPSVTDGGAGTPHFRALIFHLNSLAGSSESVTDGRKVILLDPDDPQHPTAWDGPLRIENSKSAGHCEAAISLITGVYASPGADYLLILSYSGSARWIHYIDLESCTDKWSAMKAFADGVLIRDDSVKILPQCECSGVGTACLCSSAKILRLALNEAPLVLAAESHQLTKAVIGVDFDGTAMVIKPKTSSAKLVLQ